MASIGEYEEQQQKATAARSKWVHQPGSEGWNKLISQLATTVVVTILKHGVEGPAKMITATAEEYMKAKVAFVVATHIAMTAIGAGEKQKAELADMEAELEAVVAATITKCKGEIEQGRKEMGL